jgi:hypothetical protein
MLAYLVSPRSSAAVSGEKDGKLGGVQRTSAFTLPFDCCSGHELKFECSIGNMTKGICGKLVSMICEVCSRNTYW